LALGCAERGNGDWGPTGAAKEAKKGLKTDEKGSPRNRCSQWGGKTKN